jgi:ATP-binding cassette subfamily D (ALD) long-chain fatty acid import protein
MNTIVADTLGIKLDNVQVTTPFGDSVLVRNLNFSIKSGDHLMITGPNGSGKTSILRLLAGLWPLFKGQIQRPHQEALFYIPQRPYLSIGTLRDQIIYPDSVKDMQACGKTDQDLLSILKTVYLDYIPSREGGLDAIKEWKDVFSGGEKQRIQLARLFYKQPKYVVLDEATSAVSNDVESLLYSAAKDAGITVITISHRPNLLNYHSFLLRIGEGNDGTQWEWSQVGTKQGLIESVESEIRKLELRLKDTDSLRKRLDEINRELQLENKSELMHARRSLV